MDFKTLGDWCKWLERNFSPDIMIPTLPVIIRLDGNNFSKWTIGLEKPFDSKLSELMIETTKFLVRETNAVVGYTQSDEIILILYSNIRNSDIYHKGKKQKILSKLTGRCISFFNEKRLELLPNHNYIANFDARIYQTPSLRDAVVQLLWRENDAIKNSIQSLAHSLLSYESIQNLNTTQLQDKLMLEENVNWDDLPVKHKRGTYVKRMMVAKPFTNKELNDLPLLHNARKNPNIIIERSIVDVIDYPILNKITNKVEVIFENAEPIVFSD